MENPITSRENAVQQNVENAPRENPAYENNESLSSSETTKRKGWLCSDSFQILLWLIIFIFLIAALSFVIVTLILLSTKSVEIVKDGKKNEVLHGVVSVINVSTILVFSTLLYIHVVLGSGKFLSNRYFTRERVLQFTKKRKFRTIPTAKISVLLPVLWASLCFLVILLFLLYTYQDLNYFMLLLLVGLVCLALVVIVLAVFYPYVLYVHNKLSAKVPESETNGAQAVGTSTHQPQHSNEVVAVSNPRRQSSESVENVELEQIPQQQQQQQQQSSISGGGMSSETGSREQRVVEPEREGQEAISRQQPNEQRGNQRRRGNRGRRIVLDNVDNDQPDSSTSTTIVPKKRKGATSITVFAGRLEITNGKKVRTIPFDQLVDVTYSYYRYKSKRITVPDPTLGMSEKSTGVALYLPKETVVVRMPDDTQRAVVHSRLKEVITRRLNEIVERDEMSAGGNDEPITEQGESDGGGGGFAYPTAWREDEEDLDHEPSRSTAENFGDFGTTDNDFGVNLQDNSSPTVGEPERIQNDALSSNAEDEDGEPTHYQQHSLSEDLGNEQDLDQASGSSDNVVELQDEEISPVDIEIDDSFIGELTESMVEVGAENLDKNNVGIPPKAGEIVYY